MKTKEDLRVALSPLLAEVKPADWTVMETALRRHQLRPLPQPRRRKRAGMRALLCAVVFMTVFAVFFCSPFFTTDGWYTEFLPSTEETPAEDTVLVNEVIMVEFTDHHVDNITVACTKKLGMDDILMYLGRDIRPTAYPVDLEFNQTAFEQELQTLEYGVDGELISYPTYNDFYFSYIGGTLLPRQIQIYCSKVCAQVGKSEYHSIDTAYLLSTINHVQVKIGHLLTKDIFENFDEDKMPTERYVAEFTVADIHVQVTTDNLTLEEFVAVVRSMIR